jgi:hypothetical protein
MQLLNRLVDLVEILYGDDTEGDLDAFNLVASFNYSIMANIYISVGVHLLNRLVDLDEIL